MMEKKELLQVLQSNILFRDIDTTETGRILTSYRLVPSFYHAGAILYFRGDLYNELSIICQGSVSAEINDVNGKTLQIETLQAPDIIASGILFAEENRLPVTVTARTDVSLLKIAKPVLLSICQENRTFLLNLLKDSGKKITLLSEKLRMVQFSTIRQKIAGFILDRSEREGSDIVSLGYSREVLSELFGVARPSLSRVFSEMCREGIVDVEGKHITILDRAGLELCLEDDEE